MVDKVRALKLEDGNGGTELNFGPTETDSSEDYLSCKGVAFEGAETALIWADSGQMKFKDSDITTTRTLIDAMEKIKYKTVDLTNSTTGYVLTYNVGGNFELQAPGALLSSLVQCATFSKDGSTGPGTYFRLGEMSSTTVGWVVRGTAKIVGIAVTNTNNVGANTVIQIRSRSAVATTADISGATVTIPAGSYRAVTTLNITLPANDELLAYVKSGSTLSDGVVNVFLVPVS